MKSLIPLVFVARLGLGAAIVLEGALGQLHADGAITPHPALERTANTVTKQLGDFGESFIDAGLRARGFEVFNGNVGVNGIDRFAVKRAANGELVDIRFVEVKTRQSIPDFQLAITKSNGPQLSDQWIHNNLQRIVLEHPDPNTRNVAGEILNQLKVRPEIVRRELHGIAVESDKYVVMAVDEAGRVTGVAAEGRLTSLLNLLSTRGTSAGTRAAALQHLSQFDQLQTAVARAAPERLTLAGVRAQGLQGIATRAKIPEVLTAPKTAIVVEDCKSAKNWAMKFAKRPGAMAATITFVVDEVFTGWEYYEGSVSNATFQRQTAKNGGKAAAVGFATQLVYILAPTPHGLVLIGVAIVAYVAADQAMAAYDDIFVVKAPTARELQGIIPDRCIATPMLEDVANTPRR